MRAETLAKLRQVRERQRDWAQQGLAAAIAAERRFDEQRRGWRRRLDDESRTNDVCVYQRWVDACRLNERQTEPQALELKRKVVEAEQVYSHADRAVAQLDSLADEMRRRRRHEADAKAQRALDDFRRPPGADPTTLV